MILSVFLMGAKTLVCHDERGISELLTVVAVLGSRVHGLRGLALVDHEYHN